ncbi:MAG TPA: YciI family protein [Thermoanaerobaculia bacterium]|nr:YciI family protein [Thermoanaerobaculia bacterium]
MKYMLLIYHDEKGWDKLSESERMEIYAEYGKFGQQITAGGNYVSGSELQPTTTATSVRVRDGKRLVTDGPFAETREQLGGYYLVEAKDLDEAIDLASRIPSALTGTIEVRPLAEGPEPA